MRYVHEIEKQIITKVLIDATRNGAEMFSLFDGEEWSVEKQDQATVTKEIGETEMTQIAFFDRTGATLGNVLFIHGNGADVLSDYTANDWTESTVQRANTHADKLAG